MSLLDDMFEKEALIPTPAPTRSFAGKLAGGVGAVTGIKALLGGGGQPSPMDIETEAVSSLLDPAHEAEMQRIKMQAMLTEFLASDPVISTYDPDQVVEAFNQVTQLTPRSSLQPAIMRGQLRKMLQQQDAMEPFEAAQLVDVERGLKDVASPEALPLSDLPDVGTEQDIVKPKGL